MKKGSGEEGKWGSGDEGKWGGSRSTKPCVFPCKVAAAGDERYLVCAAGAAGVVLCTNGSSYVFCKNACLCVCSSMRFLKL